METDSTKAYGIDLNRIDEAYYHNDEIVYCDNRNKAKSKLLAKVYCDGFRLKYTREELTYLNIPVIRKKEYDLIPFEGQNLNSFAIKAIISERERNKKLDAILADESITHCYIIKGNYYRPNYCGYTDFEFRAGVYPKKDAIDHVRSVSACWVHPIDNEKHNEIISQEIKELQKLLIP